MGTLTIELTFTDLFTYWKFRDTFLSLCTGDLSKAKILLVASRHVTTRHDTTRTKCGACPDVTCHARRACRAVLVPTRRTTKKQ